jgi:Flp pilus assembly protein TadD
LRTIREKQHMVLKRHARHLRLAAGTMLIAATLAVGGCANSKLTTGSISRSPSSESLDRMNGQQLLGSRAAIGKAYERDSKNKEKALAYANILRMTGQNDQALAVMRQAAIHHAQDRDVLAAYGKALAGVGEFQAALDAIQRAQRPEYPDWKLLSAEGAILDQLGRPEEARAQYRKALDIQPNEASIQSNLGMSYMLEGDLRTAETYLAAAAKAPGADSTVRQNWALVIGLQGRFEEAEQVARRELSPEQAEANVAYLRSMLAQQNSISKLKQQDAGSSG